MRRREFWIRPRTVVRHRLTLPSWLVIGALVAAAVILAVVRVHPFLAVDDPLPECESLVVEGWLPDYGVVEAAERYRRGEARHLFTTGIPIERGSLLVPWGDFAHAAEATLEKLGLPPEAVIAVGTPARRRDRTEASAAALQPVLESAAAEGLPRRVNVVTHGTHARRTRKVYRKVMGPEWEIGVISIPAQEYDPGRWWQSSAGVKAVMGEVTALVYTWFR